MLYLFTPPYPLVHCYPLLSPSTIANLILYPLLNYLRLNYPPYFSPGISPFAINTLFPAYLPSPQASLLPPLPFTLFPPIFSPPYLSSPPYFCQASLLPATTTRLFSTHCPSTHRYGTTAIAIGNAIATAIDTSSSSLLLIPLALACY